jgi:hypothetical protein
MKGALPDEIRVERVTASSNRFDDFDQMIDLPDLNAEQTNSESRQQDLCSRYGLANVPLRMIGYMDKKPTNSGGQFLLSDFSHFIQLLRSESANPLGVFGESHYEFRKQLVPRGCRIQFAFHQRYLLRSKLLPFGISQ